MNTADEVKAHATERFLTGIDFLDRTGSTAATVKRCKVVRLTYHDGSVQRTTRAVMREIVDFGFRLPTDELSDEGRALLADLEK